MSALPLNADPLVRPNGSTQRGAKRSVTLDVPLATHGCATGFAAFGIEQNPFPPPRRLGTKSRIVSLKSSLYVGGPADIGSTIVFALASQHINEKAHFLFWEQFNEDEFFARQRWAEIKYLSTIRKRDGPRSRAGLSGEVTQPPE
jgi:hypothetical protein